MSRLIVFSLLLLSSGAYGMVSAVRTCGNVVALPALARVFSAHSAAPAVEDEQLIDAKKIKRKYSARLLRRMLEHGQVGVAAELLNNARVNGRYNGGETLLHTAARVNAAGLIKPLVAAGINPNVQDIYGNTPLHAAMFFDHEASVAELLDVGARPDIANNGGDRPVRFASEACLFKFPCLCKLSCSTERAKRPGYDACSGRVSAFLSYWDTLGKTVSKLTRPLWNFAKLFLVLKFIHVTDQIAAINVTDQMAASESFSKSAVGVGRPVRQLHTSLKFPKA